jgi:hypothetical protein
LPCAAHEIADGYSSPAALGFFRPLWAIWWCIKLPERAESALIEATHLNQPLAEVEQTSIGYDYTEVDAELITVWEMPGRLADIVRYQLSPALAP